MAGQGGRFDDIDGSYIQLVPSYESVGFVTSRRADPSLSFYQVTSPSCYNYGGHVYPEVLFVVVAKEPSDGLMTELLLWLLASRRTLFEHQAKRRVIGVDTESGQAKGDACTLQLVLGDRALVIHVPRNKQALSHPSMVRLFANSDESVIFSGAELAMDALQLAEEIHGLVMHGGLDFTPLYNDVAVLASRYAGDSAGLKAIVNARLCGRQGLARGRPTAAQLSAAKEWVKDKNITCSEWGATAPLSLAQVKYCVLDAWASCRVGYDALNRIAESSGDGALMSQWLSQKLFTLRGIDSQVIRCFGKMIREAQALREAQLRAHEVTIEEVQFNGDNPRSLILRMAVSMILGLPDRLTKHATLLNYRADT